MYILIFCACIIHVWEGSRETGNQVTLWAMGTGQKENNRGRSWAVASPLSSACLFIEDCKHITYSNHLV